MKSVIGHLLLAIVASPGVIGVDEPPEPLSVSIFQNSAPWRM
jgi:hypothetical protein